MSDLIWGHLRKLATDIRKEADRYRRWYYSQDEDIELDEGAICGLFDAIDELKMAIDPKRRWE